jgi:hypothetical protein
LQKIGDGRGLVTLGGKELHPGEQNSVAGVVRCCDLIDHSTVK